jgi:peptidyl-prolyl cis-trans isomerase C
VLQKANSPRFWITFLATAAISTTTLAQAPAPVEQPGIAAPAAGTSVVATVNGHDITEADVKLAENEIGEQLSRYPDAVRRRVLIEFLIENQLFAEAATEDKMRDSSSFKDKMSYWNRRMLRDTYFEESVRKDISDTDARKFYDERVKQAGGPEVKASHILVETEDKAKEIFEEIAHGADFAEMAAKHSKDPGSKANGGSLGYFGKGRMVPEFETAAFQLKVGEVSLPVKSQFGWHLIKVEDKREREPPGFEEVKEQIVSALVREKANELGKKLREAAKIVYAGEKPKIGPSIVPGKQ